MTPIDRVDAESIAEWLGIAVEFVPADYETLTTYLWQYFLGMDEPLPEALQDRWEVIGTLMVARMGIF